MTEESSSEETDTAKELKQAAESGRVESPSPEAPPADRQNSPVAAAAFQGPIPPPSILRGYDDIIQDGAERIMTMAEDEQDHRHDLEKRQVGLFERGQWFAFILGMVTIVCGTYLIATGHDVTGFGALLIGLGSIVSSLLFGNQTSSDASGDLSDSSEDSQPESPGEGQEG